MADYRLDCCGGFPSHSPDCLAGARARDAEESRMKAALDEEKKWDIFFSGLTEEQLFAYADLVNKEIDRLSIYVSRRNHVYRFMRKANKASAYIEKRRNDRSKVQE
jgi:hypothetical protein